MCQVFREDLEAKLEAKAAVGYSEIVERRVKLDADEYRNEFVLFAYFEVVDNLYVVVAARDASDVYFSRVSPKLRDRVEMWVDLLKNRDRQECVRRMNALKEGFKKAGLDLGKAYANMYKIVEGF